MPVTTLPMTANLLRTPLVDVRTGVVARPWLEFFQSLFQRVGGAVAAPPGELASAPYLVASVADVLTDERVVSTTSTVAWDFSTPGLARATVPDNAITFTQLQDLPTRTLLGNSALVTDDPEAITLGSEFLLLDGLLTMSALPFTPQGLVAEGALWTATNTTFGTGIALSSAARTTFSATEAALCLRNTAIAGGHTVFPLFLNLLCTAPGSTGSSAHFGLIVDPNNRYSSGGTALTAANANTGVLTSAVADVRVGNVTTLAAVSPRQLARFVAKTASVPNWVIGDQLLLTFGDGFTTGQGLLAGDSPASQIPIMVPPVALAPGGNHSLLLHYWAPAQTVAPSFEVTLGWLER